MEFIFRLNSLRSLLLLSSFRLLALAIVFWSVAPINSGLSENSFPLRAATEVTPRKGLPNFKAKLDAGKSVKIAYLGGSITAAPGWRVLSLDWFQNAYPKAKVAEIHAAIGGTGSDLGVFRIQNDVLRHKPDLLFVEFAVNDGGASPAQIHKAMEGIVRQTWKADPSIDICFVYTLSEPVLDDLRNGKMQRSASAMEDVADLYSIPSIHFGVKVMAMESAGELIFKAPKTSDLANSKPMVFSTDGVHPHVETGHKVYAETIARSWPAIRDASGAPTAHSLPKPLRDDNWELARQVPITQEMLRGQWEQLPKDHTLAKRFQKNMPVIFVAQKPGAALEYTFEGTSIAVFDILGPDGGQVNVQLDDATPVTSNRVDGYGTYHRMSKLNVGSDLPNKTHHVRIELNAATLPKREILFERNRDDFDKDPSKYSDHLWYAGSLLIIGK
jgi:lysophospholipase L1-like esterase